MMTFVQGFSLPRRLSLVDDDHSLEIQPRSLVPLGYFMVRLPLIMLHHEDEPLATQLSTMSFPWEPQSTVIRTELFAITKQGLTLTTIINQYDPLSTLVNPHDPRQESAVSRESPFVAWGSWNPKEMSWGYRVSCLSTAFPVKSRLGRMAFQAMVPRLTQLLT